MWVLTFSSCVPWPMLWRVTGIVGSSCRGMAFVRESNPSGSNLIPREAARTSGSGWSRGGSSRSNALLA